MNSTSATLVAWGNAWLSGHVGLDEAVDAVERHSGPQLIGTVPPGDLPFEEGVPLRAALVRLRGLPGTRPSAFRLALPVQGDPLGLVGPGEFNQAALEAREGVLLRLADRQVGLVPTTDRRGSSYVGVSWAPYRANDTIPQVPGLAEAEQALKLTLIEVARDLEGGTKATYDVFARCDACGRVYWRGAHHDRLETIVRQALREFGKVPARA